MDYEAAARKINEMKSTGFNRNYFRPGTYLWRIDKCVAKKTDGGKDMIALEGEVVDVISEVNEKSHKKGETVVHVQTDGKFDFLFVDQLAICAALLGVEREALKGDPKSMVDALKAVFPPEEGETQSIAIGQTIRVNCVVSKKKNGDPIEKRYFDPAPQ